MESIWSTKAVKSLTNDEKEHIIHIVFEACKNNEMFEDIGEEIFDRLKRNKYIWEEEIED